VTTTDAVHALVPVVEVGLHGEEIHTVDPEAPAVGKWYWVKTSRPEKGEDPEWFGCVVHVGSNFAKIEGVADGNSTTMQRISLAHFFDHCRFEANPDKILDGEVARRQRGVNLLMGKVVEITRRLAISPDGLALGSAEGGGSETAALAVVGSSQPIDSYKTALVHAKEEELPAWLLLPAEELAAGNREVAKVRLAPPKAKTGEGSADYYRRKRNRALLAKAVRLLRAITTKGKKTYPKGTLFRVTHLFRGLFTITQLADDGTGAFLEAEEGYGRHSVSGVSFHDLVVDAAVPVKPAKKEEPEPEPGPMTDGDNDGGNEGDEGGE
jgi:hypothetical protein